MIIINHYKLRINLTGEIESIFYKYIIRLISLNFKTYICLLLDNFNLIMAIELPNIRFKLFLLSHVNRRLQISLQFVQIGQIGANKTRYYRTLIKVYTKALKWNNLETFWNRIELRLMNISLWNYLNLNFKYHMRINFYLNPP